MTDRVSVGGLRVAEVLYRFVTDELLPSTGLAGAGFWSGLETLLERLGPRNRTLLATRDDLQRQLDRWHRQNQVQRPDGGPSDQEAYLRFLVEIGYVQPVPPDFTISTAGVDSEIAAAAAPQLVVPVRNARFAINAVNARWGSLYDALYGTDAILAVPPGAADAPYDPVRGARAMAFGRAFLDEIFPLTVGDHAGVSKYAVEDGTLVLTLADGRPSALRVGGQWRGYRGQPADPASVLLVHHGLHVEVVLDRSSTAGAADPAGVSDIVIEAALTTIVDFEDSIVAVDAEDKVDAYRNWLGLNRGDLRATVRKAGRDFERVMAADRPFIGADGQPVVLPGRAVMYVRTVGIHMTTDAVLDGNGDPVGEGILDAWIAVAAAIPGRRPDNAYRNGQTGAVYIVKPKLHGADEVAFTVALFGAVEAGLGLPRNTIKLGLMDEERRLSVNLKAAIYQARERIVFVNTGFLDRSGDEIHTSFEAGPMVPKAQLKTQPWIQAYEDHNVDVALAAGLRGRAQIGKGMWAMPDRMAGLLAEKIAHPRAGASTAWVPSPTAATLHALHYHRVDVARRQLELARRPPVLREALLEIPVGDPSQWNEQLRRAELDSNVQSILGYVVRWIDQGIGCSTVPDHSDVGLMEDRATLRISSQLLANWLRHGVISPVQVHDSLARMALVVDRQNAADPGYRAMTPGRPTNEAFRTAAELIFAGADQANGYTESILHRHRLAFLAASPSEI